MAPCWTRVGEVAHGGYEAVGEGRHVAHVRAVGFSGHLQGVGRVEGERFFRQHMFAVADGFQRDGSMCEIGCGDDDGLDIVPLDDVFVARGGDRNAGLLAGAFQGGGIGIAERRYFDIRAQGESGEVVLQSDSAASDDGNAE
jgi:hypothetical protein